jgi:hypothetical protein
MAANRRDKSLRGMQLGVEPPGIRLLWGSPFSVNNRSLVYLSLTSYFDP